MIGIIFRILTDFPEVVTIRVTAEASGGAVSDVIVIVTELLTSKGLLTGLKFVTGGEFTPFVIAVTPGGAILASGMGAATGPVIGIAGGDVGEVLILACP